MAVKRSAGRRLLHTTATFAVLVAGPAIVSTQAHAGPENGVVTGGAASIDISGNTTTIQQSSDRAIIRWDNFDVNAAEHVRYQQPSTSSITVNRITDSKASRIDGRVSANGNIVLINPNGIVFGASSIVDVGGLVATTSDIEDDSAFMNGGAVKFTKPGDPDARIINNGTMKVRDAGLVGLVAPHVENNGIIQAKLGRVQLASGDIHTIDFAGDGLIKLEVSDAVTAQSVTNTGLIDAEGGDVLITAAQARGLVDALITNTGTIKAQTLGSKTGSVTLNTKGLETVELPMPPVIPNQGTGTIINTGTILTEGDDLHEAGGDITILADAITMGDGSYISAAADTNGGSIRIGGDYQGGNDVPRSNNTVVSDMATLNVSSRRYGRGGRIIIWSDDTTEFYGHVSAQGGIEGGDGGFVEISGKNFLDFNGTINLLAPQGENGVLLLDPTNISISSGSNANVSGSTPFAPTADSVTSVLNVATLQAALAGGNVIVQTRATGAHVGDITVDTAITWSSGTTLTLDAHRDVVVNQAINGGGLTIIAVRDVQLLANINGTGTLTLQAGNDTVTTGLGGGAGTFNISAAEFPFIQNGWSDIVIGRATSTVAMTVNALTWQNNLTLRSGTGAINIAATQNMGSRNLTFTTNGNIGLNVANSLTGSGVLTLQQATSNTNISIATGTDALQLTSAEIGNITDGWSKIILGRSDGTGTINMAAVSTWRDDLTILSNTGLINISAKQTFTANNLKIITDGDITLAAVASIITNAGGTVAIEQRSVGTAIGLGDSQAGVINLTTAEISRLQAGYASLTIGRADGTGDINIGTSAWTSNLTLLTGTGDVYVNNTMTMSTYNLNVTTQGGDFITTGAYSQTTGSTSVQTNGGLITVGAAFGGTTTGIWNFNSGNAAILINGNLTKTGGSATFDSGTASFTANGTLRFDAATANITTGALSGIIINNTVTQTTGTLNLTTAGGSITTGSSATMTHTTGQLRMNSNGGAITVGAGISGTSGIVQLDSGNGNIQVNGNVSKVGGSFIADSGTGSLSLQTVALGAAGAMTLTTDALILNNNISGTGALAIIQNSQNYAIGIGAGQSGNLLIDATALNYIQDGWSSRTFGRTDGTAAINVAGGLSWTDSLILQSGTGVITLNGAQAFNGNSFTIRTDADVVITGNLTSGTSGSPAGTFALVQSSAGTSMGIGDGQTGTVNLTTAERNFIQDGWASRVFGRTDGTAELNMLGGTWVDPVTLRTGSGQLNINGAMTMGGNNLSLITDSDLYISANVTGTETLTITGAAAATSIGVGDGQAGTLHLSAAELARLGTTWKSVVIGSTTATGDMNVGARTWSDPLTLRTGSGQLNINGPLTMGSNNLTIATDSDLYLGGALTGTATLTLINNAANVSFGIGDGQAGTFQLTNAELAMLTNGWGSIIIGNTNSTLAMNIGAYTWNDNMTFRTAGGDMNINGNQNAQANNLTFSTNANIAINGTLTGTGTLSIVPTTSTTSIGIGDGQAGTLHLSNTELGNITSGWTSVIIGSTSMSGIMNIIGRTWNNSMEFRTGSGLMNINGDQNMGTYNLTLRAAHDLAINYILAGTGTLTIMNAGTGSSSAVNTMAIGDSETGQLKLTNAEIARFAPYGWTTLAFGNSSSLAALNVGALNWDTNVIYRSGTGNLNINGIQNMGAGKNLTMASNADVALNYAINGTGILSIGQVSATTSMAIGDVPTGTLKLSNAELARISSGWNELVFGTTATVTSGYGTFRVGTYTWNNNVTFRTAGMVINIEGAQNMGSRNLSIITNANPIIGAALNGTGTLTIAGQAVATTMGIGGATSTGTVHLDTGEVANITNGWGNLVFGRADATGAMNVTNFTWNDNATFMTGSGLLTIAGATMGANNLTLATNSNLTINGNLSGTGTLTIRNASGNTSIGVGDSQTGTVLLSNTELTRIVDGWGQVQIGSTGSFGNINIGTNNWLNRMSFITQGNVVINGAQTTTETSGTTLVFATLGGSFINNAGASAIDPNTGRYLVYSVSDTLDNLGGLIRPTVVSNQSYTSYGPASVTESGNVFIYAGFAAKILYLQIDDVDKSYGDANPTYTYTYIAGLQGADILSSVITGYTLSAAGSNVLDDAGVTRTISGNFVTDLGYSVQVINGTLTVVKAILTVIADSDNREYGEANPALTLSYDGFKNGDNESDLDSLASISTTALITSGVGHYAITAAGGSDDNYEYVYVNGDLEITKATLTVTSQNATRVYGDTDPALTFTYTGFRNGDLLAAIDTKATGSSGTIGTTNVGSYAISGSGAFDDNYTFAYVNTGQLSITKAMLTATAQNSSRAYGDANPAFSVNYTGFKNSEAQGVIDTLATVGSAAGLTDGVGSYVIAATGATDNNYNFTYVNGTLNVTKALLTVTADAKTREYGDVNPAFTVSYSGFKNGEGIGVLTTAASASSGAVATSDVNNYVITASGGVDDNYNFSYVNGNLAITKATLTATSQNATREYGDTNPAYSIVYTGFKNSEADNVIDTKATGNASVNATTGVGNYIISGSGASDNNYNFIYANTGALSITKALVTVTAQSGTREYGEADPALGVSYSAFKNGEGIGVLNSAATASSGTTLTDGVGNYVITASGADADNYSFAYVNGNLAITKALVTVTADDKTRIYGASDPAFTLSYSGFKNNEGVGVLSSGATAGSAALVTDHVGNYAITAGGANAANYNFAYVNGTLAITKATLTATASSGTREYGAGNPAFTVSYSGFVNGDDETHINTFATATSANAFANVGTHAVTAAGAFDNDYLFNYVDGVLNVTKATLTVTAQDAIRQVGTPNPAFSASYTGFKNGEGTGVIDTLATVTSSANLATPVGSAAIVAAGAADNNYNFAYVNGVLTLTADPVALPVVITPPKTAEYIPPTVDKSLDGRYIYESFLYPVAGPALSYPVGGIIIIPEEQLYSDRKADEDFLIAVTQELQELHHFNSLR